MPRDNRRLRLIVAVLVLISLALLTIDYRSDATSPLRPVERAVASVIGPAERAVADRVRPVTHFVHFGNGQAQQIADLKRQNEELQRQASAAASDRQRAAEVDGLLKYVPYYQKVTPARVIAYGGDLNSEQDVTIDMGSADGVHPDMTVVAPLGLAGKVITVDTSTSTVKLLNDPTTNVGVRLAGSGAIGAVTGQPDGLLHLTLLGQDVSVSEGDVLVTLGGDGSPYVPDIPVGTVTKVAVTPGAAARTATVKPFVTFGALDYVGVVFPPVTRAPRDALVSPSASASGSASASAPASASPGSQSAGGSG